MTTASSWRIAEPTPAPWKGLEARLGGTGPAFIETTNPYGGSVEVSAGYLELARDINEGWGLHRDASFVPASSGWDDLLDTGSASAADAYAAMAREIGHPELAAQLPQYDGYPDVSAIRAGLGL